MPRELSRRTVLTQFGGIASGATIGPWSSSRHRADVTHAETAWSSEPRPASQWVRTYGDGPQDEANTVTKTPDGGYLFAGEIRDTDIEADLAWLVKVAADGTKQWGRTYAGQDNNRATALADGHDDGYLFTGQGVKNGNQATWLVNVGPDGTKRWEATYGVFARPTGVIRTDGGYVVVGHSGTGGATTDIGLLAIGPDGTKQWSHTYRYDDAAEAYSVTAAGNGGYLIVGRIGSPANEPPNDALLVKVDEDGTKAWDQTYGSSAYESANGVVAAHEQGYIVAGDRSNEDGDFTWVLNVGEDGELHWEHTYRPGPFGSGATTVSSGPADGYLVGGTSGFGAMILRIGPNGGTRGVDVYGDAPYDADAETARVARSLTLAHDSGYVFVGNTRDTEEYTRQALIGYDDTLPERTSSAGSAAREEAAGSDGPSLIALLGGVVGGSTILALLALLWRSKTDSSDD